MVSQNLLSQEAVAGRPVVLIGNPNVGKSALFAAFTGRRVDISNYPGTTVELTYGSLNVAGVTLALIDTPGVQSLAPHSDDERVTRQVLLEQMPWAVIQVAEAKNLRRALLLTFQLAEYAIPCVLALNMLDEAEELGIRIDSRRLSQILGADVVCTIATRQAGLPDLMAALAVPRPVSYQLRYDGVIENAIARISAELPPTWPGQPSDFILELPPIRRPLLGNIVIKTLARLEWYLKEVLPLFILGTTLLFILAHLGWLNNLEKAAVPLVRGVLGLPPQTAGVFLIGFLRRDFGAAGLFALAREGGLTANQLVVRVAQLLRRWQTRRQAMPPAGKRL